MRRIALAVCTIAVATGCGGGGSTTRPSTAASPPPPPPMVGGASVTTGPVRATLHARDHAPRARRLWPYSVTVRDAAGRPLAGTVDVQFTFGGQVVGRDSPPTHALRNGRWQDRLTFPPQAVGQPLTFQTVVHTAKGSVTLDWPVSVRG